MIRVLFIIIVSFSRNYISKILKQMWHTLYCYRFSESATQVVVVPLYVALTIFSFFTSFT